MRPLLSVSALLLSLTLSLSAAEAEKVEVGALPDAVKATVTAEAPGATMAMKASGKDGKTVYRVKGKDAEGKPLIITIGEDGAVISKAAPKEKKKE
jgi:uncharacterized protein YpmB